MRLSIVIGAYNMARELPRTLLSASSPYQKDVDPADYEVIVVDNGSQPPMAMPEALMASLRPRPEIVYVPDAPPSPVAALNRAAFTRARGEHVLIAIDGARIFSDRLVANVLRAHAMLPDALVYTLACHIGPKVQMDSTKEGYNAAVEDRLIAASGWPRRPEGLYEISVLAGSSDKGFFEPVSESNAFSLPRSLLTRHRGYDERFVSPGAGLANLELFARYATLPAARNVCLLSDVTFHQVHGGVATSGKSALDNFKAEYQEIFGRPYARPQYEMLHLGPIRGEVLRLMRAE